MSDVETTRVSSRGQVVIPKAIREELELEEGDQLAVYGQDDAIVLRRVRVPEAEELREVLVQGSEQASERQLTREDVMEAVRDRREDLQDDQDHDGQDHDGQDHDRSRDG